MQHIIKKQVLDLTLNSDKDMFSMQQKARDFFYQQVLPVLENTMDALAGAEYIIQFDKWEIDLGILEWDQEKQEITESNWKQVMEEQIGKLIHALPIPMAVDSKGRTLSIKGIPKEQYACEQWLYYMRMGYLDWNVQQTDDNWHQQVLEALATDYRLITKLKTLIAGNENAVLRIANNHAASFLVKLIEVLTAQGYAQLPVWIQELALLFEPDHKNGEANSKIAGKDTINWLWQVFLKEGAKGINSEEILQRLLKKGIGKMSIDQRQLNKTEIPAIWPHLQRVFEQFGNSNKISDTLKYREEAQSFFETDIKDQQNKLVTPDGFNNPVSHQREEEIFTLHAGLLLLHPFLQHLFQHTSLTEKGKFKGTREQETAIHLLHYMATGDTTAAEYQLVVPKILCGYPLALPFTYNWEWNESMLDEANNMMTAAIQQWTILKNTSVDGLREGFLQRNGKIYTKDQCICFMIEPSSIDILLDQLPWNLSIIKLPWLEALIRVEWR